MNDLFPLYKLDTKDTDPYTKHSIDVIAVR
jgi:hypothetical protein